jgi:hypothetical protein
MNSNEQHESNNINPRHMRESVPSLPLALRCLQFAVHRQGLSVSQWWCISVDAYT